MLYVIYVAVKKDETGSCLVVQQVQDLVSLQRVRSCLCCGVGLIPGPGTSICCEYG